MADSDSAGIALDAQAYAAVQEGNYETAMNLWYQILGDDSLQSDFEAEYVANELPFNYSLALYMARDGDASAFKFYGFDVDKLTSSGLPGELAAQIMSE